MLKENATRIVKALILSYAVTIILLLMASVILYKCRINQEQMLVFVIVIYMVSNFCGGFVLSKMVKGKRLLNGIIQGALYFVVLSIASWLVNKGIYSNTAEIIRALAACIAGGVLGGIIG